MRGVYSNSLVRLLSSDLENVEVAGDAAFDRALKAAVAQGGSDPEAVLAALKEELGLTGVVNFSASILGGSSVGSTALKVEFEAVASSSVAANAAANSWLGVLRYLPADGAYSAKVSMVEVNGGYILAIEVTVEQSSSSSSSDDDDDNSKPDTFVNGTGFSYNVTQEEVTVTGKDGLKNLFDTTNTDSALTEARNKNFEGITITLKTLEGNETYTVNGRLAETFKGTLQGEEGSSKPTITLTGNEGLFGTLEASGEVAHLDVTVTGTINTSTEYESNGYATGAVADVNNGGTITGCKVTLNVSINNDSGASDGQTTGTYSGGIVGKNNGTISSCEVIVDHSISAVRNSNGAAHAGGIAGDNFTGTISGCTVTVSTAKGISATGPTAFAGGIAGNNSGTIEDGCEVTVNGFITATSTNLAYAGGIAGRNNGDTVSCNPVASAQASAQATVNGDVGKYTATISAGGGGSTTATDDTLFAGKDAQAGILCGYDSKNGGNPTPQSSQP